jgi:hypothetical protein
VLLFSFEGLDLLEERMANGPLIADDGGFALWHFAPSHRLSAIN